MQVGYKRGQASVILRVKILDSSVSTGAGKTGLTSASSGLIISTIADNEASATAYTVAGSTVESITTLGTYAAPTATKCRFKEVDATNHPGLYEIQLADARFAVSSAKSLVVSVSGASNAAQTDVVIALRDVDPYDSMRGGLTALPNVAAGANGGLPLAVDASGRVDVLKVNGTSQTAGDLAALINAVDDYIDTEVAAIKAKTDNLPSDPADASDIATATTAIIGYVDTEVAAIKAKTDQMVFTKANELDTNIQSVNGVTVNGTGASGAEWGP